MLFSSLLTKVDPHVLLQDRPVLVLDGPVSTIPVCNATPVTTPRSQAVVSQVNAPPKNAARATVTAASLNAGANGQNPPNPADFVVVYNPNNQTLNVTPAGTLAAGQYTVVISLNDANGNPVATVNLQVTVQ